MVTIESGEFVNEKCPQCGCSLLGNKIGDRWCSRPGCIYGIAELEKRYRSDPLMPIIN